MIVITTEKIIEIHDIIIDNFGGARGILQIASIDFLISEIDGGTDVFETAAIILHGIITRHPFVDGHKRTAFEVADIILREEGYHLRTDKIYIENMLLKIAKYECKIDDINKWLKKRCRRLKKSRQLQLSQTYH